MIFITKIVNKHDHYITIHSQPRPQSLFCFQDGGWARRRPWRRPWRRAGHVSPKMPGSSSRPPTILKAEKTLGTRLIHSYDKLYTVFVFKFYLINKLSPSARVCIIYQIKLCRSYCIYYLKHSSFVQEKQNSTRDSRLAISKRW